MAERRAIFSGSAFEEQIGYARAVVDGDWVHVSGTTGFDYSTMTISDDVVEQAEQCLRNIKGALAEAECTFADVVRVRYLLPCREDFPPCWPVLRRAFGDVRPAATMLMCGLADPRMKIEIEVYARRASPRGGLSGLPDMRRRRSHGTARFAFFTVTRRSRSIAQNPASSA